MEAEEPSNNRWIMQRNDDEKLSALLRQWRGIEPRAGFASDVQRRIRLAGAVSVEQGGWAETVQRLLGRPALAVGLAVAVSIIIGSSAGLLTGARTAPGELRFLSAGTLAGGYVQLTSRGAR